MSLLLSSYDGQPIIAQSHPTFQFIGSFHYNHTQEQPISNFHACVFPIGPTQITDNIPTCCFTPSSTVEIDRTSIIKELKASIRTDSEIPKTFKLSVFDGTNCLACITFENVTSHSTSKVVLYPDTTLPSGSELCIRIRSDESIDCCVYVNWKVHIHSI